MKKGIAVPYIIALILGIAVLGLLGYWFFVLGGRIPTTALETACREKQSVYCTRWAADGYADDKKPDNKDFSATCPAADTYARDCCSLTWAQRMSDSDTACKAIVGET